MKLSEFSIHKPITTIMIVLSVVVLGAISLFRLPLEYAPDISWPAMYVSVSYPSSSPEEIERNITRPIEEVMGTLSHVEAISSRSFDSGCYVRLQFAFGTDMDLMAVQVRDRVDQVKSQLPADVEQVRVLRWNTDDWPIITYAVTWLGSDPEELADVYKQTILPRLQRLEGVGSVDLGGMDEKALLVNVSQNRMTAHNLDIRALNSAIRTNNVNISAGYVHNAGRRLAVRSVGQFETVDQIRHLPIRPGLELEDVANVTYDYPEKKSFEHLDGRDAVTISIRKASTANLVATSNRVKAEMAKIVDRVGPDRLRVKLIRDRSVDVTNGLNSLSQSAIMGGILAILVIFVFLRSFRSTVIIGSAIPISALCVFMFMYLLRQLAGSTITLNLVSMMGLMVAVGMLVDPAVVALENIYRKRFEDGQDAWTAALEGSQEIGMPVVAGSLTTICVFIPLIFVTNSGRSMWMRDFGTTVVISVIASLCVALTLIPLAASRAFSGRGARLDRWLKRGLVGLLLLLVGFLLYDPGIQAVYRWTADNLAWFVGGLGEIPRNAWILFGTLVALSAGLRYRFRNVGIKALYVRLVNATLRYRWTTVTVACCILASGYYIYGKIERRPPRWEPTRRVDMTVEVPRSYNLKDALNLFDRVENLLLSRKKSLDIDAVISRYSNRHSNRLTLYLTPADEATLTTDQVKEKVLALMPKNVPGVTFKSGRGWGSTDTGVGIEIKGRDPQILDMLAEDIQLRMRGIKGVMEVESSLETGTEEIQVNINRQRAQRYGLSPLQVATTLATALGTRGNSKFETKNGEINITLQLKEEDRASLEQLKNTTFSSDTGGMVTFASLADFHMKRGPRTIERDDRMSTVTIFASTESKGVLPAGREMARRMRALPLPSGYSWQMDRRFRQMAEEQGNTNFTMIFAAMLIYLIMASLFESYVHPFTIMFSICFAFIGVAVGMYAFKVPMDSNASYGLLILFGIVVNNGIVLVDHINRYRQQGLFRREAIIRGGQDRLRPIAMTATTTILGLAPLVLPMLYGTAEGTAKRWGPIGFVVICGLAVSTLLTLILLPTIYSLMDDFSTFCKRVVASARAN